MCVVWEMRKLRLRAPGWLARGHPGNEKVRFVGLTSPDSYLVCFSLLFWATLTGFPQTVKERKPKALSSLEEWRRPPSSSLWDPRRGPAKLHSLGPESCPHILSHASTWTPFFTRSEFLLLAEPLILASPTRPQSALILSGLPDITAPRWLRVPGVPLSSSLL